eukprot:Gb_16578 [translate_table: standard]
MHSIRDTSHPIQGMFKEHIKSLYIPSISHASLEAHLLHFSLVLKRNHSDLGLEDEGYRTLLEFEDRAFLEGRTRYMLEPSSFASTALLCHEANPVVNSGRFLFISIPNCPKRVEVYGIGQSKSEWVQKIGWTFRSREVSPFFTVIPTCNSTGQRTFPPIFSIEMNEKDFKNLNFKEWHIGVAVGDRVEKKVYNVCLPAFIRKVYISLYGTSLSSTAFRWLIIAQHPTAVPGLPSSWNVYDCNLPDFFSLSDTFTAANSCYPMIPVHLAIVVDASCSLTYKYSFETGPQTRSRVNAQESCRCGPMIASRLGKPTPQSRGEDAHRPMLVVVQHPSASRLEVSKDAHCSHEASSYSLKSSRSNFSISSGISLPLPRSRSLSLVSDTTTFEDRLRTPSESFVCQGLKGANGVKYCKNEECSFSSRNNADEKSSLLYMQEVVVDMKGFRNYSLVPSSKRDCKECLKLQKENLEQQSFIVRASSLSL